MKSLNAGVEQHLSNTNLSRFSYLPIARGLTSLFVCLSFDGSPFFDFLQKPRGRPTRKPRQPIAIFLPVIPQGGESKVYNPSYEESNAPIKLIDYRSRYYNDDR